MAKTCIICSAPAGSNEHVFPAAFGGRRTNRGIYCHTHNQAFGRHVAALLNSLDIVNAVIGVIPDRHKQVRPAPATAEDGERYLITKGTANIAPPRPLQETPELVGKLVQMRFADETQAARWIAQQEKAGYKLDIQSPGPVRTQIVVHPLRAERVMGDEAFMRSIVYLALTFLAHGFPNLARAQTLAAARDLIDKDGAVDDRVWWEPPETAEQLEPNPFTSGHTVVIGPDADGRRVCAFISFYGALHLAVNLGTLDEKASFGQRFTTHIDPLASSPPDDIVEIREDGKFLALSKLETAREYLHGLRSAQACNPLGAVFRTASQDELKATCEVLLLELIAAWSMPTHNRVDRILKLLTEHHQRIFNLMLEGIRGFLQSASDVPKPVHVIFETFIAADDSSPRGISLPSEAALTICTAALTDSIQDRLNAGTLDATSLANLLGGSDGVGIVLRTLTNIVAYSLPKMHTANTNGLA